MLFIKAFIGLALPLAAVAAPTSPPPKAPAVGTYQSTVLYNHNIHRANHSAPNVTWSASMQKAALVLAKTCLWGHNTSINGGGYGQNLAAGIPPSHIAAAITDSFYNGEMPAYASQYGKPTPNMTLFGSFGHFTQVVWKGTTAVGCATHDCAAVGGVLDPETGKPLSGVPPWFTVCNYVPAGNYMGEFGTNVGRPLGHPVVQA